MIKIKNKNIDEIWEYEGLKVIQTKYPDKLNIELLDSINKGELSIIIDNKSYSVGKIININSYTKTKDLHNLTKNNPFIDNLSKMLHYDNLINIEELNNKILEFNSELNSEFLSLKLDKSKLLSAIFNLNDESFINENELNLFLEKNKNSNDKKLIIFCNICWLSINKILKYSNYYNFLVLTSDFADFFKNYDGDNLDGIIVINNENKFVDLIDFCQLSEYLTQRFGQIISEDELIEGICSNKSNEKIEKICQLIKKI